MNEDTSSGMHAWANTSDDEVGNLLEAWQSRYPRMGVLALVAEKERDAWVKLLQRMCNDSDIPLQGGVFPALIAQDRFLDRGCILLRFDVMPFARIYDPITLPAEGAVEELAHDVAQRLDRPRENALVLIFDAMVPTIATFLDGLYLRLADRVRYMGANAGSETFKEMPCLFDNERIAEDAVLAILM
ncbi:MAG TPA: FIST N-terminal domain-containing protein, partial [Geobacteraceae bacterium]